MSKVGKIVVYMVIAWIICAVSLYIWTQSNYYVELTEGAVDCFATRDLFGRIVLSGCR